MVKIRSLAALLLFAILLCSCKGLYGGELELFSGSFVCEYSYSADDTLVRARLTSEKSGGEERARLEFLEPEALCGVVCEGVNGDFCINFNELSVNGASADALASSALLFFVPDRYELVGRTEIGGQMLEHYKLFSACGLEVNAYVDGKTELPVRLSGDANGRRLEISVISFERF